MTMRKVLIGVLLCPLLTWAADCANPLFSSERWSSSYTRPAYLSSPQPFHQSDPPLCPLASADASCCNSNTTIGIADDYVQYIGSWYGEWMREVAGVIQDAFNDFNPVVQQLMKDYNWSGDDNSGTSSGSAPGSTDSASGNSNSSSNSGSTSTSTVTNPNSLDQSEIDDAFSSEPATGVPDSYASIEVAKGEYVVIDSWSAGRAKQRLRSGILSLSEATRAEVRRKANDMNGYMMQLSYYGYQCKTAYRQHMVGMLCMGCEADYSDWVSLQGGNVQVLLSSDTCDTMYDSCKGYLRLYQDLPQLVAAMTAAVKGTIESDPAYAQFSSSIWLSDLDSLLTKSDVNVCDDKNSCKTFLCTYLANGVNGIFPDRQAIADPAGLLGTERRLEASVSYVLDSNGFDSISAGQGEGSIVIPMMATAEGDASAANSEDTAPFADSLDWASALSLTSLILALVSH